MLHKYEGKKTFIRGGSKAPRITVTFEFYEDEVFLKKESQTYSIISVNPGVDAFEVEGMANEFIKKEVLALREKDYERERKEWVAELLWQLSRPSYKVPSDDIVDRLIQKLNPEVKDA